MREIVRWALLITAALSYCSTIALSQTLSGIKIGDGLANVGQQIGFPPSVTERTGPFTISKWELGDHNSLSVTANTSTGRIVYLETDWGNDTSYTDFPRIYFGKTTLEEIKRMFGRDNFGWNGGPLRDGSIAMQNSYRIQPGDVIITFTTTSRAAAPYVTKKEIKNCITSSCWGNLFGLAAISLGDQEYLSTIWGKEHLPRNGAREVALDILQPGQKYVEKEHENDTTEVKLTREGGTFLVPVQINGRLTINFTLDSGAADVQIPADVLLTLYRTGTVSDGDFLGSARYTLANRSTVPSDRFRLHILQIGDHSVYDVAASIGSVMSTPLLGQSFLSRLGSWTLDNDRHVLVISGGR